MDQTRVIDRKTISRYRIDSVLGSGAMGMVYLAFDQQIQRQVALKVLHPHLRVGAAGEELEQRFLQEARAAARCTHPNIVTVFDFGIHNGESFIVMEYVKGTELKGFLNQGTPIPLLTACDICVQVLEALAHAHDSGVIHRDIKPANIMMLDNSVVKVSDFGVARLDSSDLTGTGMMIGTPNYMSPEARSGVGVDHRSDLYSVGVLLYELICSQKPDLQLSLEEILANFEGVGVLGGQQLARIKSILSLALQPQSAQRYQHARAFIADLKRETHGAAAAVDATRLVMPKPGASAQASAAGEATLPSHSRWHPDVLISLERGLAQFVGPLAKRLVRRQSQSTQHFNALVAALAQHIPNEAERTLFTKSAESKASQIMRREPADPDQTLPTSVSRGANAALHRDGQGEQMNLPEATFKQLSASFAHYMGPLASRIVKTTMRSTSEPNALLCELASRIPSEDERERFMSEAKRLF